MEQKQGRTSTSTLIFAASLLAISGLSLAEEAATESTTARHELLLDDDAWINDIGSLLYSDDDGDGYFSGLSLSIDADSRYNQYEVYLVVDIVDESDVTENLHTTHPYYVYGRSISDEYRIDIDLVQNYYPGIYDLQITLVEARENRILDQVSARDFRNLRALPLESEDNQTIHTPVTDRPVDIPNDDIRVTEYAGSTGIGILLTLIASCMFRVSTGNTRRRDAKRSTRSSNR